MSTDLQEIVDDLVAESATLTAILDKLEPRTWYLETPAAGWRIADQVSHLAYFDETTRQSLVDPVQFRLEADELMAGGDDFSNRIAARYRDRNGAELLSWFRLARLALVEAYRDMDPERRLPWYGPDMSPASSITARLMETWAHGQDIADAVGAERAPTMRLRHVAYLGVRALPYAYKVNRLPQPSEPIRVELVAPDGSEWSWGPPEALNRVSGDLLDFCLVVTQRRDRTETMLDVKGSIAAEWMGIAQAYAGPAGTGRPVSAKSEVKP